MIMRTTIALIFVAVLTLTFACADERTCGDGTVADGGICVPDVAEGCPDKYIERDGECVPEVLSCGAGTTLRDGACIPIVTTCANGTHPQAGECIPDLLAEPDADVLESDGATTPFTLPMPSYSISINGVVNTPVDETGDGYVSGNLDAYTFSTPGVGTYLRITVSSVGATLPAFMIMSSLSDEEGYPLYRRWGLEPNAAETSREVYLPFDDTYVLMVSDYANTWPYLYGFEEVPVGGDEHTYHIVIENLGTPSPTAVSTLPFFDSGTFDDGALRFYSLASDVTQVAAFIGSTGDPVDGVQNDVFPVITTFDADGEIFAEVSAPGSSSDIDQLLPSGSEFLVVYDFGLIVGPDRDFAVAITEELRLDCDTDTCKGTGFDDGHLLLGWSLDAGDFLAVGVYPDAGGVEVTLVDPALNPLQPVSYGSTYGGGGTAYFVDSAEQVYLRIREAPDSGLTTYTIDEVVVATNALTSADSYPGLGISTLPDDIFADAGLAHLQGVAGDIVIFEPIQAHGAGWVTPTETLYAPNFQVIGPAVDSFADDFPYGTAAPLVAVLPADGYYLHVLHDADDEADIAACTYDASFVGVTPTVLVPPTVGVPSALAGESLANGYAVYTMAANAWERCDIVVTPDSGLRPAVWVLTRGKATYGMPSEWWEPDAMSVRLGLVGRAQAGSPGDVVTVENVAIAHDAEYVIVVADVDGSGPTGFDLLVTTYATPANNICTAAEVIDFASGSATITGSTAGAHSSLDLDWGNDCTGQYTPGPDLFYAIDLNANAEISINVSGTDGMVAYLVSSCAPLTCEAGTHTTNEPFTFTPATTGRYFIAVDGSSPAVLGDFTLEVGLVE